MREARETDFCHSSLLVKQRVLLPKASRAIVCRIAKEALSETSISFYLTVFFCKPSNCYFKKEKKRLTQKRAKSWLHLLLVKCKLWKDDFKRKPAF